MNIRLDSGEENTSELEDNIMETIQNETQKKEWGNEKKKDLWENFWVPNVCVVGVPDKGGGQKIYLNK